MTNSVIIIGVIINVSAFIFSIHQYNDTRKKDQKNRDFEAYHKIIKELVQSDNSDNSLYIDRQASILYELRHFERYYEISYRTVVGLKNKWEKVPDQFPRLLEECDLTIIFLKNKLKIK